MDLPPPSQNASANPLGSSSNVSHRSPQTSFMSKVETILFNSTLKVSALRLALLASASVLGCAIAFFGWVNLATSVYIVILPVTFVHQFISAFKLRYVVQLLDLILLIAEITLLIKFVGPFFPNRFAPSSTIVLFVAIWGLISTLLFLLICRLAAVIRHRGGKLLDPFDFLEDSERIKAIPIKGMPAAYSILISRSIWRIQFFGEGVIVRLIRGAMAGVFITALIAYGVLSLVVKPVQETALTPVRESRGSSLPSDQLQKVEPQNWNFIFTRPIFDDMNATGLDDPQIFHRAVNVTPLWEVDQPGDETPRCTHSSIVLPPGPADDDGFSFQNIHVQCLRRAPAVDDGLILLSNILPDILIEVDYGVLGITPNVLRGMRANTIGVSVGFTGDTDFLTEKIAPLVLPSSSHYLVGVTSSYRRALKHPALSGLGMFEGTDIFSTAEFQHVVTDPLASISHPPFNISARFSTLRVFVRHDPSEIRIIQDSREQSVLGGFSAVGGLWTSLGGIFTMIFGTSLMRIFFGSRSLSIFGIAQQLEKKSIAAAYLDKYPKIQEELLLPQSDHGIMKLLQDHIVDVSLFDAAIAADGTSTPGEHNDVEKQGSTYGTPGAANAGDSLLVQ